MASSGADEIALLEAAFRVANERMAAWPERYQESDVELHYCECARPACRAHIPLTKDEYEAVRADSRWFVVVHGHAIPDVETVIESHERYDVVRKPPEVLAIVTQADPRRGRPGPIRERAEEIADAIEAEARPGNGEGG